MNIKQFVCGLWGHCSHHLRDTKSVQSHKGLERRKLMRKYRCCRCDYEDWELEKTSNRMLDDW